MCRKRGRAEPTWLCLVVVGRKTMQQRGLGVQAEVDKMGLRWWEKCQRTFSNPSLSLLVEEIRRMDGEGDEKQMTSKRVNQVLKEKKNK